MYKLCMIALLLSAVVYTNAATSRGRPVKKPAEFADQKGCYLKDENKVIPFGDYHPENTCLKLSCYENESTQSVSCGTQSVAKGSPCRLVDGDLKKDYPDCCPTVMCSPA